MLGLPVSAYDRTAHGWYCMRNGNEPPCLESQFSFIEKYDGYFLDKEPKDKVIYLTFDAGYENGNVAKIADVLKKHNATGAFFVLDNFIKKNPELTKRLATQGNLVCNHTASHRDMTKITDIEEFKKELTSLEDVYTEYTGLSMPKFYRPPEGKFSEENLCFAKKLGYKTVFWSLAYADWDESNQMSPQAALNKVMSRMHNGAIILLHPTSSTNAKIMPELIKRLKAEGYEFGTLDEL